MSSFPGFNCLQYKKCGNFSYRRFWSDHALILASFPGFLLSMSSGLSGDRVTAMAASDGRYRLLSLYPKVS